MNSLIARSLEHPLVYRLWQAPFTKQKLYPVIANGALAQAKKVLDLGCGPGMNTGFFPHADYLGIDINPSYVEYGAKRYRKSFKTADIREYVPGENERYDFILLNSFLHHIDDKNVGRILGRLGDLLSEDGAVHIMELVLPEEPCLARQMAKWDRGDFARSLPAWRDIFNRYFDESSFSPFSLRFFGAHVWQMVYFKGVRKGI